MKDKETNFVVVPLHGSEGDVCLTLNDTQSEHSELGETDSEVLGHSEDSATHWSK